MLVFAREVFVCRCSTAVPRKDPAASELARQLVFRKGTKSDLARVDPEHHNETHVAELAERLERGEHWMLGELDGQIATYTWLHSRPLVAYPSLPGCEVTLRVDTGYGYDAWTPPSLRGHGLRRSAFLEELCILGEWGLDWEASFFVKHQLEGATRSLGGAGIEVVPLWRVFLKKDRSLGAERLHPDADAARPTAAT